MSSFNEFVQLSEESDEIERFRKTMITFVQNQVKIAKKQHEIGKIDLPTLQLLSKSLNNVAAFASSYR